MWWGGGCGATGVWCGGGSRRKAAGGVPRPLTGKSAKTQRRSLCAKVWHAKKLFLFPFSIKWEIPELVHRVIWGADRYRGPL